MHHPPPTIPENETLSTANQESKPTRRAVTRHNSPPPAQTDKSDYNTEAVPHAMRSSFVLGVSYRRA